MAKKEKMVDLKPKAEKISDEQLKELQGTVSTVNRLKFDIGTMETQKHNLLHALFQANEKLLEIQEAFKKEYDTSDINIQDGTINYPENGEADKKD